MIICTTCPLPSSRLGTRIKLWFPLLAFSTLDLTVLQVIPRRRVRSTPPFFISTF